MIEATVCHFLEYDDALVTRVANVEESGLFVSIVIDAGGNVYTLRS